MPLSIVPDTEAHIADTNLFIFVAARELRRLWRGGVAFG